MTEQRLMQAAIALADVLDAENAALRTLDIRRAVGLLERKQAAMRDVEAAQREAAALAMHLGEPARRLAERLQAAAAENKRLLERAITVQRQVIGKLAHAVPAASPVQRYGASGARTGKVAPIALRARA